MTKKIICLLLCFTCVLSLVACGGKDEPTTPTEPSTNTQPSEPVTEPPVETETAPEKDDVVEYREGSVEYVAQSFIKNLITGDFEAALRNFAVPAETPYFTAVDVEWYLPRSNYADVLNITYDEYNIIVEKQNNDVEAADCRVVVKDKNSDNEVEFNLHLVLDKQNKWGVQDHDFYLEEFWVVAPGGKAVLTVDGVDATADIDSKYGDAKYRVLYKLNYIGKSEKKFAVSSDNFETYEESIYAAKNTKEEPAIILVKYEDEAALTYLKNTWAEIYQAVLDGKSYSEMVDKLSPSADPAVMDVIMKSVDIMRDDGDCTDFQVSDMSFCTDDEWLTHWMADDKLMVSFNYTLNWVDNSFSSSAKTMNYYDWMILHFDGTNFTIDTLSQKNYFFSRVDEYNNDKK